MNDWSLQKSDVSGVFIFGFYKENKRYYFTCLNQGKDPLELNFDLAYPEAMQLFKNHRSDRIYVPINNPKLN